MSDIVTIGFGLAATALCAKQLVAKKNNKS
jgi:hypothetical protein